MKYTIFSIDSRRQQYIDNIRAALFNWDEVATECVNGNTDQLQSAIEKHGYEITTGLRVGHLGIWHTVLNALDHAPIVTFEDDAILGNNFKHNFTARRFLIPRDFDFFSLFIPRDSDHLWTPEHNVNQWICRPYQRYGGVSMLYSEQGAQKIRALLQRDGIRDQYDNTLYAYAKNGELNGYCSRPDIVDLVKISGEEASIVQESDLWEEPSSSVQPEADQTTHAN